MQALVLCPLKHRYILEFLGLYRQQREEFELTFIISPWMDRGDVVHFVRKMTDQNEPIPRIQWVSTTTHTYGRQFICFTSDLRYRLRTQVLA